MYGAIFLYKYMETILDYITTEVEKYNKPIEIEDGWNWNMREHLRRSFLYINSQFFEDNDNRYFLQGFLHKYKDWKYEKESRWIARKCGVYQFKPECLKEVYFGVEAKMDDINAFKKLLKSNALNVNVYKARISEKAYKILFDEVQL